MQANRYSLQQGTYSWPKALEILEPSVVPWVKTSYVRINFPIGEVTADQVAIDKLSFNLAQSVVVYVHHQNSWSQYQGPIQAGGSKIIHYLQELALNARNVHIVEQPSLYGTTNDVYLDSHAKFLYFLLGCFAKGRLGMHDTDMVQLLGNGIQGNMAEITHPELSRGHLHEESSLVRKCAQPLQVLKLHEIREFSNISGLITDDVTKELVVYPNMKHLPAGFIVFHMGVIEEYSEFPGAIPFPNLQTLRVDRGYPFGDNVLFRGNQSTLRYMDLNLTKNMAA